MILLVEFQIILYYINQLNTNTDKENEAMKLRKIVELQTHKIFSPDSFMFTL